MPKTTLHHTILSIHEAAELLGVADKTLRRWEESGVLIPLRSEGGHRRYRRSEVEKFKKRRELNKQSVLKTANLTSNKKEWINQYKNRSKDINSGEETAEVSQASVFQPQVSTTLEASKLVVSPELIPTPELETVSQLPEQIITQPVPSNQEISSQSLKPLDPAEVVPQTEVLPAALEAFAHPPTDAASENSEQKLSQGNLIVPQFYTSLHSEQKAALKLAQRSVLAVVALFVLVRAVAFAAPLVSSAEQASAVGQNLNQKLAQITQLLPAPLHQLVAAAAPVPASQLGISGHVLGTSTYLDNVVFDVNVPTNLSSDVTVNGNLAVNSGTITSTAPIFNIASTGPATVNLGGAATNLNLGSPNGTVTANNNLTVKGLLTVGKVVQANGVKYSFPSTQGGGGTVLGNDGTGNLTWVNQVSSFSQLSGIVPFSQGGTNNGAGYAAGSVIFSDGSKLTENNANFFWDNGNARLGIGTNAPAAALSVGSGSPFQVNNSGLITDSTLAADGGVVYTNTSGQFLASTGGTFGQCLESGGAGGGISWVSCGGGSSSWQYNNGFLSPTSSTVDVGIGGTATTSAKFAFINVSSGTPTASISGTTTAIAIAADGSIQTVSNNTLTLGGNSTGDINLRPLNGTGQVNVNGTLNSTNGVYTGAGNGTQRLDANGNLVSINNITAGGSITFSALATNNGVLYTNASGTVQQTAQGATGTVLHGNGISAPSFSAVALTTDVSGILPIANGGTNSNATPTAGSIAYGNGSGYVFTAVGNNGECLISAGTSTPTWGSCGGGGGGSSGLFESISGAIVPINSTEDFLIGGQATAAAKFAFLNVNSGTPTASVSGGTAGATYFTSTGTIQTTADQALTIGGDTTGNITLNPLNGTGITNNTGNFNLFTGKTYQINNTDVLTSTSLGTNVLTSSLTTVGALSSGTIASGFGTIATANTITGTTLNGTVGINTGAGAGTQRIDASGNLVNIVNLTASGTITLSGLNTAGGSLYTDGSGVLHTVAGSSGQCLISGGASAPTWSSCGGASGEQFQTLNGAIVPLNSTEDFLIGGQASASAKFALLNVNLGTPTASIAGSVAGNGLYMTGDGTIATTLNRSLALNPNGGNVGIGTSTPSTTLELKNTSSNPGIQFTSLNRSTLLSENDALGGLTISGSNNNLYMSAGVVNASQTSAGFGFLDSTSSFYFGTQGNDLPVVAATASRIALILKGKASQTGDLLQLQNSSGVVLSRINAQGYLNSPGATISAVAGGKGLVIAGATSQTDNLLELQNSGGTPLTYFDPNGNLTITALNTAGGIVYTNSSGTLNTSAQGSSGQCLVSGGTGAPAWTTCSAGSAVSPFESLNGAIVPINSTEDFFIGGQASASAKFAVLNVNSGTPTASIAGSVVGNSLYMTGDGKIATTNREPLTLGDSATTGNVAINAGGSLVIGSNNTASTTFTNATGTYGFTNAGSNSLTLSTTTPTSGDIQFQAVRGSTSSISFVTGNQGNFTSLFLKGNSDRYLNGAVGIGFNFQAPTAELQVQGSYGGNAAEIVNQLNTGDIFTASSSGLTKFTINNAGNAVLANLNTAGQVVYTDAAGTLLGTGAGSTGQCLVSGGSSTPSWSSCAGASGDQFQSLNGAIVPYNTTEDFLIGGQASASAKFALLNINNGTPTASVSAGTAGAAYIAANGSIQTTARQTLTLGGSTTGNVAIASASGGVSALFDTTNNRLGIGTTAPSAELDVQNPSIASTNGIAGTFNGLTTGYGLALSSTSTALTTGGLGSFDWSPGSATTATGDLVSLNVGANGTIGNIFNVKNAGSSVFSVGQNQIVANLPTAFTAPGDVTFAYDLNLTNPTSSFIKSASALYLQAGDTFGSSDLTLRAFNSGNVIADTQAFVANQAATIAGQLVVGAINAPANIGNFYLTNASTFGKALAILNQTEGSDIFTASASGATKFTINSAGNVIVNNLNTPGGVVYTDNVGTLNTVAGSSGQCLVSNGTSAPSWTSCSSAASNFWTANNGALYAGNTTFDLLVGGTASSSAKFAVLNVNSGTPTASVSAGLSGAAYLTAAGNLQTTADQTLTVGGLTTGNINLSPLNGTGNVTLTGTSNLVVSNLNTAGGVVYTNSAGQFGTVAGSSGQCLISTGAGTPSWSSCGGAAGEQFQTLNGAIVPLNSTEDFLVGGQASASAKFAFLNVNSGTPTASIAGSVAGNGLYMSGDGTIATTLNRSLALNPTGGNVGIGTSTPAYNLDVLGVARIANNVGGNYNGTLYLGGGGTVDKTTLAYNNAGSTTFNISTSYNNSTDQIQLSPGGNTRLVVQQGSSDATTGYVGIGTTSPVGLLNIADSVTTGGSSFYATASAITTGNIIKIGQGGNSAFSGNVILADIANTGGGGTNFTGNFLKFNNNNATEFSVNNLGSITSTALNTAGQVLYTNSSGTILGSGVGSTGQCLVSGGSSTPTWTTCSSGSSVSPFESLNGAIVPLNSTEDFLVGGQASSSAKFAFLNVNSGTPTASIAGSVAGNGLYMSGDGTIATTLNRNLALNPNGGSVGIGTSSPASTLNIAGTFASTNDVQPVLTIDRITSGTAANGIGGRLLFRSNTGSGGTTDNLASIDVSSTTVGAADTAKIGFLTNVAGNGLSERASLRGNTFVVGASSLTTGAVGNLQSLVDAGTTTIGNQSLLDIENKNTGNAAGARAEINFAAYGSKQNANIGVVSTSAGGQTSADLYFGTKLLGDTVPTERMRITSAGLVGINSSSPLGTLDVRAVSGTTAVASISGSSSFANLAVDQSGSGDIFTASVSGLTKFNINNAGNVTIANLNTAGQVLYTNSSGTLLGSGAGSTGQCLVSGGTGSPTWATCSSGSSVSPFETLNGAIVPLNSTEDFLVGGQASSSAKFAFLNVNSGTPTASVSSGLSGTAAFLTADGTLATQNRQSLTIGNSSTYNTTGNVLINPNGTGNVGIGTNTPGSLLTLPANTSSTGGITFGETDLYRNAANSLVMDGNTFTAGVPGGASVQIGRSAGNGVLSVFDGSGITQATILASGNSYFNGGNVGIGTANPVAHLQVTDTATTTGDIFDATSSAITSGNLLKLGEGGNSAFSGNVILADIANTGGGGTNFTGNFLNLKVAGSSVFSINSAGAISGPTATNTINNLVINAGALSGITGYTQASGNFSMSGSTGTFGTGTGNVSLNGLTTVTGSNTLTIAALNTAGGVVYTNSSGTLGTSAQGSSNQCLISNGSSAPSWSTCSAGSNFIFTQGSGSIYPINSTEDFLLGGQASSSAKFAVLNLNSGTPTASVSAGLGGAAYLTGTGNLQTTGNQSLVLGGATTGAIVLNPTNGTGFVGIDNNAPVNPLDVTGAINTSSGYKISNSSVLNSTTLGSSVVNSSLTSVGTLTSLSSNGTITFGNLNTAGGVVWTNSSGVLGSVAGSSGQCLISGGASTPSWTSCSGASGAVFESLNGAIVPYNSTQDLLVGGQASASAKFAFLNVNLGTPTASISAGTAGGLYLTAAGTIQTTTAQSLNLGGTTTGAINFLNTSGTNFAQFDTTHNTLQIGNAAGLAYNRIGTTTINAFGTGATVPSAATDLFVGGTLQATTFDTPYAETLTVAKSGAEFTSIQSAYTYAKTLTPTATNQILIHVMPGTYTETLTIDTSNISVAGDSYDTTKITSAPASTACTLATIYSNTAVTGVTISGLTVETTAHGTPICFTATNPTITVKNSKIVDSTGFAGLSNASTNAIFDNDISIGDRQAVSAGTIRYSNLSGNGIALSGGTYANDTLNSPNISGGTYSSNLIQGLINTVTVSAGTFSNNTFGGSGSSYASISGGAFTGDKFIQASNNNRLSGSATFNQVYMYGADLYCGSACSLTFINSQLMNTVTDQGGAANTTFLVSNSTLPDSLPAGVKVTPISSSSSSYTTKTKLYDNFTTTDNVFSATASAITTGNILKLAEGGNSAFSGNVILADISNTGGGGTNFTGNFVKLNNAGVTKYLIDNAGNASQSGNLTLGNGSVIQSAFGPLTLNYKSGANTWASGFILQDTTGNIGIGNTSPLAHLDLKGAGSGTLPVASISGATTFANTIIDQSGLGDIFTASKSGATKFTVLNNGNVQVNNLNTAGGVVWTNATGVLGTSAAGSTGQCLVSGATGSPTWSTCSLSASTSPFQELSGAIVPNNSTEDFLIGGQASASAKFAFLNVNSGTPVASVSSGVNGISTFLTADGTLGTQNRQSLTIGNSSTYNTTGNVLINPNGTGNVGIGTTAPANLLTVNGTVQIGSSTNVTMFATGNNLTFNTTGASDLSLGNNAATLGNWNAATTYAIAVASGGTGNSNRAGMPLTIASGNSTGNGAASYIAFSTSPTGSSGTAENLALERLRIDGLGNVGINTTSPLASLDVRATSGTTPVASFSGSSSFATLLADQTGSGDIFTASKSGSTKFVIANSGNVGIGTSQPAAVLDVQNPLITTTNGISGAFNGLTTGKALNITSTSTALTNGGLASFDWSPGSATTATGDLVSLNVGVNGIIGNIFNVKNNGSSVFSVSQTQITAALPTAFTAAGDVSAAYDLSFTNPVASYIKSTAPITIQSGEVFNSSDLTFANFNSGSFVFNNNGTTNDIITSTGRLGVGTAAPNFKLDLTDSQASTVSAMITNTSSNANAGGLGIQLGFSTGAATNHFITFLNGTGTIQGGILGGTNVVVYQTHGIDFAEYFTKDDPNATFTAGTLMCEGTNGARACQPGDKGNVLGIVSGNPGFLGGAEGSDKVIIGMTGQVPVNVTNESGMILAGDTITYSPTQTGVGSKQIKAGSIVGRALQPYYNSDPHAVGQIMIQISNSYYDPDAYLAASDVANYSITQDPTLGFVLKTPAGAVVDKVITAGQALVADLQVGNITAKNVTTDTLSAGSVNIGGVSLDQYITQVVQQMQQQASASAAVANGPYGVVNSGDSGSSTASGSGSLADSGVASGSSSLSASASGELAAALTSSQSAALIEQSFNDIHLTDEDTKIVVDANQINQYLDLKGSGFVGGDLGIGRSMVLGQGLAFTDSGIDFTSIVSPANRQLNILGSGQGHLSILAGLMTLDDTGRVNIAGDLTVNGRITTGDQDAAGLAEVEVGDTEVTVTFARPYAVTPIITATPDDSDTHYVVVNKSVTGFTIELKTPAVAKTTFSWTAVSAPHAVLFSSSSATPSALFSSGVVAGISTESAGVSSGSAVVGP